MSPENLWLIKNIQHLLFKNCLFFDYKITINDDIFQVFGNNNDGDDGDDYSASNGNCPFLTRRSIDITKTVPFKGTRIVISSNSLFKKLHVQFSTIPCKDLPMVRND